MWINAHLVISNHDKKGTNQNKEWEANNLQSEEGKRGNIETEVTRENKVLFLRAQV